MEMATSPINPMAMRKCWFAPCAPVRHLRRQVPRERAVLVASERPILLVTPGSALQERLRTLEEVTKLPPAQVHRPWGLWAMGPMRVTTRRRRVCVCVTVEVQRTRGINLTGLPPAPHLIPLCRLGPMGLTYRNPLRQD